MPRSVRSVTMVGEMCGRVWIASECLQHGTLQRGAGGYEIYLLEEK